MHGIMWVRSAGWRVCCDDHGRCHYGRDGSNTDPGRKNERPVMLSTSDEMLARLRLDH